MYLLSLKVKVLASSALNGDLPLGSIIFRENLLRVFPSHNARSLIVQQRGRVTLENAYSVT